MGKAGPHTGGGIRFETVAADALGGAQRAALGDLLADAFIDADGPEQAAYVRVHAHWSVEPIVRVIALDGPRIVGQVSVYRMGPDVMGLGGGAVAPSHRRRRIMARLLARGLELCGDDVVLARTVPLRALLCDEFGFRPVQLPQLVRSPDWLGRGDLSRVGELELNDV
jgi:GNAT superfamily N-acetyltransferase